MYIKRQGAHVHLYAADVHICASNLSYFTSDLFPVNVFFPSNVLKVLCIFLTISVTLSRCVAIGSKVAPKIPEIFR